jgi:hypothetical protein
MRRLVVLPLVTITLLVALAAPVAAATTTGTSHYLPGPGARPAAAVSPSGCVQTADYPHPSTHVRGTMGGAIRARCRNAVPELSHSAQMWETRWWGWDRIGAKGSVTKYWSNSANAFGTDHCRNSTVRVTGSGFVIDVDGLSYYASTESKHVTNPCRL